MEQDRYHWKITQMNTVDQPWPQTVHSVDWLLTLTDQGHSVSTYGSVVLPPPGLQFIPYDDLVESRVIAWTKANIGSGVGRNGRSLDQVYADLEQQLSAAINPSSAQPPLPWDEAPD